MGYSTHRSSAQMVESEVQVTDVLSMLTMACLMDEERMAERGRLAMAKFSNCLSTLMKKIYFQLLLGS